MRLMRPLPQRVLACALLLIATHTAAAQTPKTVLLENLTWTELREQIHAGKTTIIIPIGGTEQSGPDVALGKHNARVAVLSQRIAEGLGNALRLGLRPIFDFDAQVGAVSQNLLKERQLVAG